MARLQLALNVSDLEQAVSFYSGLFGTPPARREAGYANFAVHDPPLKLVLFEGAGEPGSLNHLGVEHPDREGVARAHRQLGEAGLAVGARDEVDCCHSVQDKAWVPGPDGLDWEIYTVLADRPSQGGDASGCCAGGDGLRTAESGVATVVGGGCCGGAG